MPFAKATPSCPPLFSVPGKKPPALIGIARLASESELLESKRRVQYRELESRTYIGRCSNTTTVPFEWTINPYRGCEFGCKYCYARYTHEFMELRDGEAFETMIFAKRLDRAAFARELRQLPDCSCIGMGTATDPYQPAERRFNVTRSMLEEFTRWRGMRLWITTKSDLIARDAGLLAEVAKRHDLGVTLTITTTDVDLARLIEPYAPRPDLRLKAVETLASRGIQVRVFASPLLPLINDGVESLTAVAQAARAAGAIWFGGNLLFLQPCAKKVFFPFLDREMPDLAPKYRLAFDRSATLPAHYREMLAARVDTVRESAGLGSRDEFWKAPKSGRQLKLPL